MRPLAVAPCISDKQLAALCLTSPVTRETFDTSDLHLGLAGCIVLDLWSAGRDLPDVVKGKREKTGE